MVSHVIPPGIHFSPTGPETLEACIILEWHYRVPVNQHPRAITTQVLRNTGYLNYTALIHLHVQSSLEPLKPMRSAQMYFFDFHLFILACLGLVGLVALQQALVRKKHPKLVAEGQSEMRLINASIRDLSEALQRGEFTSVSLVEVGPSRKD